jgi:hypothetical protein
MAIKFILIFSIIRLFSWSIAACPNRMIHDTSKTFCYQSFTDPTSWITADHNCNRLGGHLASVDSTFLNTILNGAAQENMNPAESFWLGSTTMFIAGQWSWSDGSNSSITNWVPGTVV